MFMETVTKSVLCIITVNNTSVELHYTSFLEDLCAEVCMRTAFHHRIGNDFMHYHMDPGASYGRETSSWILCQGI